MRSLLLVLCWLAGTAQAEIRIVDGDTLDLDGVRYRINGIDAPEAGQTCKTATGRDWRCGKSATETLAGLTDGRRVTCRTLSRDSYGRDIARCSADGQDLARQMVLSGMAWAFVKFSDEYEDAEASARAAGRGIWQGEAQPAWDYRAMRWSEARTSAPEGCPIKGNISRRGRIYHAPWSPWYTRTKINLARGERWFCSEAEAIAAGWRAPNWH